MCSVLRLTLFVTDKLLNLGGLFRRHLDLMYTARVFRCLAHSECDDGLSQAVLEFGRLKRLRK